MTKFRRIALLAGMLSMIIGIPAGRCDVVVNQTAPDFALPDSHGKQHSLSDFRGKYVVLEWVNYECPFTLKHYTSHNMQGLQKKFTDEGVIWLSINSSAQGNQGYFTTDEINKMMAEKGAVPSAYLIDDKGDVGRLYGAKTTPHMFIIDPAGTLVYQGAIDDKASTDLEDIPQADNYVVQALGEAMSGKKVSVPATQSYGCSVKY